MYMFYYVYIILCICYVYIMYIYILLNYIILYYIISYYIIFILYHYIILYYIILFCILLYIYIYIQRNWQFGNTSNFYWLYLAIPGYTWPQDSQGNTALHWACLLGTGAWSHAGLHTPVCWTFCRMFSTVFHIFAGQIMNMKSCG